MMANAFPQSLPQLNSPPVRALAWSCFAPPLLNETTGIAAPDLPLTSQRREWLEQLDRNDRRLRDYLEQHCRSPRLGLVFESLWHFFLIEDPHTELLAHNLPVRQDGRTLGEFDVLYHDMLKDHTFHLELAVKFFLARHAGELPFREWLGPNSADRLDRKLERLLSHQLELSQTPAGQQALKTAGIVKCEPQLRVAGMLFYPEQQKAWSHGLNPDHPTGDWFHIGKFRQQSDEHWQWRLLEKPYWLDADYENARPLDERQLDRAEQRPVMLINKHLERCFVVPDDWPRD